MEKWGEGSVNPGGGLAARWSRELGGQDFRHEGDSDAVAVLLAGNEIGKELPENAEEETLETVGPGSSRGR